MNFTSSLVNDSNVNSTQPDEDKETVKSTVAKSRSGPIIGIIIAIVVFLSVFYVIRTRCVKKRENGWEIRKSVSRCRCFLRPPRSEEDGI